MPSPRPLHRIMAADETLAGWQARHAREAALTGLVRRALPRQLGERVHASELADGAVELVTSAGAVAAAVRQRSPDLLQALVQAGWPCTSVRVRVQVRADPAAMQRKATPLPDRAALAPMVRLAHALPPGPLKTAVARLLRKTGGA